MSEEDLAHFQMSLTTKGLRLVQPLEAFCSHGPSHGTVETRDDEVSNA